MAFALFHADNLDKWTREELTQLVASLNTQFGQPTSVSSRVLAPFVQRGAITIADTFTNQATTLPVPVSDVTRAEVRLLGFSPDTASQAFVELTNANTITARRNTSSGATIVSWEVTDWRSQASI